MTLRSYDLVVIGTGSAASAVAFRCRKAGWNVAVIDSRPFGGTCVLRGCDPKKVLIAAAEALHWGQRMSGRGVRPGNARIDWPELMAFKRTFTDPVPENREKEFAQAGIESFKGACSKTARMPIDFGQLSEAPPAARDRRRVW